MNKRLNQVGLDTRIQLGQSQVGADLIEPRPFYFKIVNRSSVCPLILQPLLFFAVALFLVKFLLGLHLRLVILQIMRLFASFLARLCLGGQKTDIRKRFCRIPEPVILLKLIYPIAHGLNLLGLFVVLYLFPLTWGEQALVLQCSQLRGCTFCDFFLLMSHFEQFFKSRISLERFFVLASFLTGFALILDPDLQFLHFFESLLGVNKQVLDWLCALLFAILSCL